MFKCSGQRGGGELVREEEGFESELFPTMVFLEFCWLVTMFPKAYYCGPRISAKG